MKNLIAKLRREPVRVYLYGVIVAVLPVLVQYDVLDPGSAPVWLNAAAGVLVVGGVETARAKVTPVKDPRGVSG